MNGRVKGIKSKIGMKGKEIMRKQNKIRINVYIRKGRGRAIEKKRENLHVQVHVRVLYMRDVGKDLTNNIYRIKKGK